MSNRLSVVVSSCDFFSDCWEPFIYSIQKYWPDCPYDIYIVSNHKSVQAGKVRFITVGEDKGWASNLKRAISMLDTRYVLYMQEDYWLTRKINTALIESQIDYCDANKIDYLRMSFPFMDKYKVDKEHARSDIKDGKYALCLQTVLFNRESLSTILVDGWTGWDYERTVSDYIRKNGIRFRSEVLLSTVDKGMIFSYPEGTAVRKGKWTVEGERYLRDNGFTHLIPLRKVEGKLINRLSVFRGKHSEDPLRFIASVLIKTLNKLKLNI